MLRQYLQHQLERALRGQITNGLLNCHIPGMHSVVFHDENGNRVRMFYATPTHRLHRNDLRETGNVLSLAIHGHHCDVRFVPIFGDVTNIVYTVFESPDGPLQEMAYQSAIKTGVGALTPTGKRGVHVEMRREQLSIGNVAMRAQEMHTIYVPYAHEAAWMVIEGAGDATYESTCWTNNDRPEMVGLYQPMSQHQMVQLINAALRQIS